MRKAATGAQFRPVGPGVFELGKVRLNKKERTVTFPAVVNMREGLIEYLVVTTAGKTHESLLRSEVQPHHIHLAMLLLGARGIGTNAFPDDATRPIPGERLTIEVSWRAGAATNRFRAEQLVKDRRAKALMTRGDWVYNGSRLAEGVFLVEQLGSIVSLIADEDALINNPRPSREDDENWEANPAPLPPLEAPVQVTLRLENSKTGP